MQLSLRDGGGGASGRMGGGEEGRGLWKDERRTSNAVGCCTLANISKISAIYARATAKYL